LPRLSQQPDGKQSAAEAGTDDNDRSRRFHTGQCWARVSMCLWVERIQPANNIAVTGQ
jgi:hypothetical protein